MKPLALFLIAMLGVGGALHAQTTAPARDGEIRTAYHDVQNATDVWLTLEPRSPNGQPLPAGMLLTFTWRFEGKQPAAPPTDVDVRAYAGRLWAPRLELSLLLDGRTPIDLSSRSRFGLQNAGGFEYLPDTMSIRTLQRVASAKQVTGNMLGQDFALTEPQRRALRAFVERVLKAV